MAKLPVASVPFPPGPRMIRLTTTLRAAAVVPPIVMPVPAKMPTEESEVVEIFAVPAAFKPMRLPWMRWPELGAKKLPIVIWFSMPPPAMRLRAAGVVPPIRAFWWLPRLIAPP